MLDSGRFIDEVSFRNHALGWHALATSTDFLFEIKNGIHCKPIWPACHVVATIFILGIPTVCHPNQPGLKPNHLLKK
jgi:hypothetical protein